MANSMGSRLREARANAGIRSADLSLVAGHSHGIVSLIETGQRAPGAAVAANLALALGCSLEWLASGRGKPPTARRTRAAFAAAVRAWQSVRGLAATGEWTEAEREIAASEAHVERQSYAEAARERAA